MRDFSKDSLRVFVAPRGYYTLLLGRASGCDIIVADEHISAKHLIIKRTGDNNLHIDVLGRNGAVVNESGIEKDKSIYVSNGAFIDICGVKLLIGTHHIMVICSKALLRSNLVEVDPFSLSKNNNPIREKTGNFTPTVRKTPVFNTETIELDMPPARKNPDKQPILLVAGPALTMAVPILLGSGRKIMIIAGFIAAIWAAANVLNRRNRLKKEEVKRRRTYTEYVRECEKVIEERYREIRNTLVYTYPSSEEYLKNGGNIHLVWNRKEAEGDKYYLRLGLGNQEFPVEIKYQKEKFSVIDDSLKSLPASLKMKYKFLKDVPICVDIAKYDEFAIVTNEVNYAWEIAYSLILQLSLTLSTDDIQISVIAKKNQLVKWISLLPHNWINGKSLCFDAEEIGSNRNIIESIDKIICIFTDDSEVFNALTGFENVVIFFITDQPDKVPVSTKCIMHVSNSFSGVIYPGDMMQQRHEIHFDRTGLYEMQSFLKQISALSSHIYNKNKLIPTKVLLTDIISDTYAEDEAGNGVDFNDEAERIIHVWKKSIDKDSLSVPIGIGDGGRVINLDLEEKSHGPHGIVAGTTGSGKSELLQTLVLSLAMNFSPQKVCFFLIDYKGGGMANVFDGLPHVAGSISNLSGSAISRAFVSIKSEIEYRQTCFLEKKVNNIRDYEQLKVRPYLPHIIIIIDEFAELKREEPEFMAGLVSVAQVGRSLGVHLILATQKPSGVVDDKIWSNSRFRICLKVRDKMDSSDMLHRPDAAYITDVGRAFLQVGNDEIFEEFQCAYTAAPAGKKTRDSGIYLYDDNLNQIEIAEKMESNCETEKLTQIESIKNSIIEAFEQGKFEYPKKLWCEELGSYIMPDEESCCDNSLSVLLGVFDDPSRQLIGKYSYNVENAGNTVIIGMQGSGKSTVLMRMLYGLLHMNDPQILGFYIMDYGGKRLKVYEDSKLCGGYISTDEWKRTPKLLRFISEELHRRQSNPDIIDDLPSLIVVIDNYGTFSEYAGAEGDMDISEMMRISRSLGVYFLITANNIGASELPNRILSQADTVITLSLKDKYAYSTALSTPSSMIPAVDICPGRGVVKVDKKFLQFQCYIPVCEQDEKQWNNKITADIKTENIRIRGKTKPFPYVPDKPTINELSTFLFSQIEVESTVDFAKEFAIGYIEETGKIYNLPIDKINNVLITGRKRSGRKNTLKVIEYMAGLWDIPTYHINTLNDFYELIKEKATGFALCADLGKVLNDFYQDDYSPEKEKLVCEFVERDTDYSLSAKLIFTGVIGNKDAATLIGRKIWSKISKNAYGIAMGGSLDEQNLFDFSYLSYSKMSIRKKAGTGNVAFCDDDLFAGGIVIPLCDA